MKGLMMDFPLTVSHLVDRAERLFPSVEVVSRTADGSAIRTTHGATIARARRLAAALRAEGLQPGDRVATLLWNDHVNLETYLGVPLAGGVLLPLNLRLLTTELQFILSHARPRWILVDPLLWPLFERIHHVDPDCKVLITGDGSTAPTGPPPTYEDWIARSEPLTGLPAADEDDAVGLFYTTGTTGKSKGILYSNRSTVLHAFAAGLMFEMRHRDAVCIVMPMSHAHAAGQPHMATILGTKLVLPGPSPSATDLLDLFDRERVTFTAAVPRIWGEVLDALEREPDRWHLVPGFRCVTGGSALPETMIRRFDKAGIEVIHIWGMTETGPVATVSPAVRLPVAHPEDADPARRARQGFPVPFLELRIRPNPDLRIGDDPSRGELEVRGPWVARAYYEQPDLSTRWTADGWFRTGDIASLDAEGYIRILDRIGDLVKVGDEWASSVEVENQIMDHPAVREAAVVARVDPEHGELPHAVVVLRPGVRATADELHRSLEGRVPDSWRPTSYSFVEAIPKTSVGKVAKQSLREALADGKLEVELAAAPPAPAAR